MKYTNAGSRKKLLRNPVVKENGEVVLEKAGYDDIQDKINSFADSCDIQMLLQRFMNGETSVLAQRQGIYADLTNMPKTYAEVLQKVIDGKRLFDQLPQDVRDKFGNDFNQWFAQMDSENWFEKMGFPLKEEIPVSEEVKEDV